MTMTPKLRTLGMAAAAVSLAGCYFIKASNPDPYDRFGWASSVSDNLLLVGAPEEDSAARAVNGEESDNSAWNAGAAYVYNRDGDTWSLEAYLKPSNAAKDQRFGKAVAAATEAEVLVVGAPFESGDGSDPEDTSMPRAGAVYVFERNINGRWTETGYLKAKFPDRSHHFGDSVAVSADGSTIIIGAPLNRSASDTVNFNEADDSLVAAGAAYVFVKQAGAWTQTAFLKPENPGERDLFGTSVDVNFDGSRVVVGAQNERSGNGDPVDNSCINCGAAYVFDREGEDPSAWHQSAYLKPLNPVERRQFGRDVAINDPGTRIAVGAPHMSNYGPDEDDPFPHVYIFELDDPVWYQAQTLTATDPEHSDAFGHSLDFSPGGRYLMVGAPEDNGSGTGINPADDNDPAYYATGAAYIYEYDGRRYGQTHYIKGFDDDAYDVAGYSVSISGAQAVMGIPGEDSGDTGANNLDGDEAKFTDNSVADSGAAMLLNLPGDLGLSAD